MTHTEWNVGVKRALEMADRRPASSLRTLRTLMRAVESSLKKGLHEWHLAQTSYIMSLVQAGSGDRSQFRQDTGAPHERARITVEIRGSRLRVRVRCGGSSTCTGRG